MAAWARPVVDKLTSVANDSKNMIVAPRDDLPGDTSFSVTAWNKVVNCGKDITPEQAIRDRERLRRSLRVHQQRSRTAELRGMRVRGDGRLGDRATPRVAGDDAVFERRRHASRSVAVDP